MRLRTKLFATTMFTFASAALATPAFAQAAEDQPAPTAQAAEPGQNDGLTDIVVTAQRQSESAQRAAVPLSVIQGEALLESGVTQVDRLNNLAPALAIVPTNTGNAAFVRGVGNFTLSPNSDPAIAFNYDGVYVGRPTSTTGVFYDLDRVEILKGPQGILYGRNATAGAINILPAQPRIGELSGYLSATYGNYNTLNVEGAINIPVGETGAIRISAARAGHDGYLSDGTSDEDTWAARVQLKVELTPSLTVRVAGDFAHNGGLGSGVDYVGSFSGTTFTPSGLPLGTGLNAPASQAYRTSTVFAPIGSRLPALSQPFQGNTFIGFNANIEWRSDAGTLTIIPAWRQAELNFLANAGGSPYFNQETDSQTSLEIRFAGRRIGPVDYQIGVYYFDESLDVETQLTSGSTSNFQRPQYDTTSYAAFGRLTLHATDRLRFVGGLRYTQDNKTFNTTQLTAVISCTRPLGPGRGNCPTAPYVPLFNDPSQLGYAFPAAGGAPIPIFVNGVATGALSIRRDITVTDRQLDNGELTYRGAVEFDLAPQSLLYVSVERGFRSGGFSVATGFETYQPETIIAYTIGIKNRFFDNRLQANFEAFRWDYSNQQVSRVALDLGTPPNNANYVQNIGSSTIQGFEVDTQFLVTPNTLVSANVQYLDTQQEDYIFPAAANPPPITGCATTALNATQVQVNCSGFPSYNSPRWTLNFGAQQTIPVGDYEIVLSADTQHRTSRYIGFAYLPQQLIGATWTSNAQIRFGPQDGRWSIAAYIRNIEDERIPVYSIVGSSNFLVYGTTAPQTYGVRVSARF